MLDVALVNYLGAGWCSLAPAFGLDVPAGATVNGKTLLQLMHNEEPAETQKFVEDAVQTIWTDWLGSGMPASVAATHLEVLPKLIEQHSPSKDTIIAAIAITTATNKLGPAAINAQARRLSSDIIEQAREAQFFQNSEISDGVTFYFLEAMYDRLLRAWPIVACANVQLRQFCEDKPWQCTEATDGSAAIGAQAAPQAEQPSPSFGHARGDHDAGEEAHVSETPPFDMPEQAVSDEHTPSVDDWAKTNVQAALAKRGTSTDSNDLQTAFFTETHADLIRILSENALMTDEHDAFARRAERAVTICDFADADVALASLEQSLDEVADDPASLVDNPDRWLARCRSWRGKLQELQFDFRRAARHYEVATKYLPRENYDDRWIYIERQINALASHDKFHDDPSALDEAIKICTGFIVVLHDSKLPACQASARVSLARILLAAGERNGEVSHLDLALRHLADAIEILERDQQAGDKTPAMILVADILNELGFLQNEPNHLEHAVRQYQDILGSGGKTVNANDHVDLGQRLGVSLARLGQRTHNAELLALSVETLRKALAAVDHEHSPAQTSSYMPRAYTTLAEALTAQAAESNDGAVEEEARNAYRKANELKYLDPHYPPLQRVKDILETAPAETDHSDHAQATGEDKQTSEQSVSTPPEYDLSNPRTEHQYLAKLRETLREAHSKQSPHSRNNGASGKLSA